MNMLTIEQCDAHAKTYGYNARYVAENRIDYREDNHKGYTIRSIYYTGRVTLSVYNGRDILPIREHEYTVESVSNKPSQIVKDATVKKVITVALTDAEFSAVYSGDLDYHSTELYSTLDKCSNRFVQSIIDRAYKQGIDFIIFHNETIVRG